MSLVNEVEENILDAIKSYGPITGKELADDSNCSIATVNRVVTHLKTLHPNLRSVRGKGYFFEEDGTSLGIKNHEGYPDPTATQAINNLAKNMMEGGIKEEEKKPLEKITFEKHSIIQSIYSVSGYEYFFILSVNGPYLWCVAVEKYPGDNYLPVASRLFNFDVRKTAFSRNIGEANADLIRAVMKDTIKLLGLENYISDTSEENHTELALLRQRAEIYENAFYAVCGTARYKNG